MIEDHMHMTPEEEHRTQTFGPLPPVTAMVGGGGWGSPDYPKADARNAPTDNHGSPVGLYPRGTTAEADPTGRDAHTPGAKLDAGKIRAGLVLGAFPHALRRVCEVGTYGANKYTDNGWLSVPNGHARYTDAMLRHYLSEMSGERFDKDTGIEHAAHLAWNALARLELMLREA